MELEHTKNIADALTIAIRRYSVKPAVLRALLHELNLSPTFVARSIGLATSTLSNCSAGRNKLSSDHHDRLVALLRAAVSVAAQTALPGVFKENVDAARKVLEELDV
ncbi:MAG: hypothetical protein ABW086_08610 [Sedimenticola sp.]